MTKEHANRRLNSLKKHWVGAVAGAAAAIGILAAPVAVAEIATPDESDVSGWVAVGASVAACYGGVRIGEIIHKAVNGIRLPESEVDVIQQYLDDKLSIQRKTPANGGKLNVNSTYLEKGALCIQTNVSGDKKEKLAHVKALLEEAGFDAKDTGLIRISERVYSGMGPSQFTPSYFTLSSEDKFPAELKERLADFRAGGIGLGDLSARNDVQSFIAYYETQNSPEPA